MKIIAFAASSSGQSINKKLVEYACICAQSGSSNVECEVLDLNDFEIPLFSVDLEKKIARPQQAQDFLAKILQADALNISFAEHNGSYTAAYKNLFDWCSRIDNKVYRDKPMLLLAASPGKGGAKNVLQSAVNSLPHFGARLVGSLSIPLFTENFEPQKGQFTNQSLDTELKQLVERLHNEVLS